ncbi:hypothetical protein LRS06_20520 [Hymenobacter sp. J193]|uniref:hypothetical protein n=1 Tax=Hymenobacter sp. J193 TaxID=2898429 RepID=UPI002151A549|nr:hypothetical protein [Hymenobacter sp. J193]MCR5890114.1 hypothetical protein [Hymenobacter sp. J193]
MEPVNLPAADPEKSADDELLADLSALTANFNPEHIVEELEQLEALDEQPAPDSDPPAGA